jgi:hypothetical protein
MATILETRSQSQSTDPLATYREECSGWALRLVVCWVLWSVFDDSRDAYPTYCISNSCPSIRQLADGSIGVIVVVVKAGVWSKFPTTLLVNGHHGRKGELLYKR